MSRKIPAAVLAALLLVVPAYEGVSYVAYKDPVGIPTICFGSTAGVHLGQTATKAQCDALLKEELFLAAEPVQRCITADLTDGQYTALVSLSYNAGPKAVCGSTLQKKFNQGDYRAGCDQIKRWVYARGIKLPGLVTRRNEEHALCVEGLQ